MPGVPDFRRPPKERSVIQIRVVDPRRLGLLQGIPLKTVPILDLYRYQRARRAGDEIGMATVPGKEYIDERIAEAQELARRFESAGPLPHSPISPQQQQLNNNNNNNRGSPAGSPVRHHGTTARANNSRTATTNNNTILRNNAAAAANANTGAVTNTTTNNYSGVPPELSGVHGYEVTLADDNTPPPPSQPPAETPVSNSMERVQPRRHTPQDV